MQQGSQVSLSPSGHLSLQQAQAIAQLLGQRAPVQVTEVMSGSGNTACGAPA